MVLIQIIAVLKKRKDTRIKKIKIFHSKELILE
jgi:hypothetical protein